MSGHRIPADEAHICPEDHAHGENHTCYTTHRCRCEKCRDYAREHRFWLDNLHRAGKTPPGAALDGRGVRRRLEALFARGWSTPLIAEYIGVHRSLVLRWLNATVVEAKTITRVSAVYEALCEQSPPTDTSIRLGIATRTRRIAAERGYVGPEWWFDIDSDDDPSEAETADVVDVVAVELAVAGERVTLSKAERHEAVRQLNARGFYDREIARMLAVADRTVLRDRKALGIPEANVHAREAFRPNPRAAAA